MVNIAEAIALLKEYCCSVECRHCEIKKQIRCTAMATVEAAKVSVPHQWEA